jgi:hypothetical protein
MEIDELTVFRCVRREVSIREISAINNLTNHILSNIISMYRHDVAVV